MQFVRKKSILQDLESSNKSLICSILLEVSSMVGCIVAEENENGKSPK